MTKKYAVRNIRLCTKDCLCLYVCPTGATDTENSVIDVSKCIGCGDCAGACPSGAISMVPEVYPQQQPKTEAVINVLRNLMRSKSEQEMIAAGLPGKLAMAIEKSNHIMAEDIIREAGYMLPQSGNVHAFLQKLVENPPASDFPKETAEKLLKMLKKQKKKRIEYSMEHSKVMEAKTKEVMALISAEGLNLTEYSDTLVFRIVETVTVLSSEEIKIRFIGGFEITQPLY